MLFYQHSILLYIIQHNWFRPIIAYRCHYRLTVAIMHTLHTLNDTVLGDLAQVIRARVQLLHSGALNLISTAQSLGCQKLLSRVALTSKWVVGSDYQKNLRRRLRLERVVDGLLVIPWEGEGLVCSVIRLLCCLCRSLLQSCPHK